MRLAAALPRTPTASRTPPWPAPPHSAGSAGAALSAAPTACRSTALTFGEELNVDGRVFLVAYAAGMETAIRVGAAAKGGFHHTGFHATGVVAHFSASVVAARLLNLSSEAI